MKKDFHNLNINLNLLVTGGAGFIGSNFVGAALGHNFNVTVLDALTYAGNKDNLIQYSNDSRFKFVHGSIQDTKLLRSLFEKHQFSGVIHFAAESHVDNSISGPRSFIETNIVGTFELLEESRNYYQSLQGNKKSEFRFVHVSTDEVFGSLGVDNRFTEKTPYAPNSPYSASKAASDFLARAWYHTYGFPVIITNCSNNFGPFQFPEKLIPRMIVNCLNEKKLPVYGEGINVRDWIHVEDHCEGVILAYQKGKLGESYCFGGNSERKNIDVVKAICRIMDQRRPRKNGNSYLELIEFVKDRLGHDFRYAIDDAKAQSQLGFIRKYQNFESGLEQTVDWYLENLSWLEKIEQKKNLKN